MKKFIVIGLILVMLITACISCCQIEIPAHNNPLRENIVNIKSDNIHFIVVEDKYDEYGYMILCDQHTGNLYCFAAGFQSSVLTPIYNNDGTVKLYETLVTD